jgi:hypothetical protein
MADYFPFDGCDPGQAIREEFCDPTDSRWKLFQTNRLVEIQEDLTL